MSNTHDDEPSPEQVFSNHGLHRALTSTAREDPEVDPSYQDSKDHKYRQYICEREAFLLNEFESARKAFDQVTEERDVVEQDLLADASTSAEIYRRYLQANNRLAKAGREYRTFVADVEELMSFPEDWSRDDAQAWSDRKTMERMQREEAVAKEQVNERYEERLREANDHRIVLAEQNLELMTALKDSMLREEALNSEVYDLGVLIAEASDKFTALGYTWRQGR